mmetsp:Transcript_36068/g.58125  ORF Transcript_36068/g.58125 Transcript_36068/m.58125 type:complete len:117 (+) Transcript_36068:2-352(+)
MMKLEDGSSLLLAANQEGEPWVGLVKQTDTTTRLNPQDLPGYYEGFLTDERENAAALDNLTPNIKLAASATALVLAAVGFLIFQNPPPPSDKPLPVKSRVSPPTSSVAQIDVGNDE